MNKRRGEGEIGRIWGCLTAALFVAASCGGGGSSAEPLGPPPLNDSHPWDGPAAAYIRVDVALVAGVPQIQGASRVTTPPLPVALGGDVLAVMRASDGTALDSATVQFDTIARSAGYDGDGNFIEEEEVGDTGAGFASVFLLDQLTLDRIELLDAAGNVASSLPAADIAPATPADALTAPARFAALGSRTSAATVADLQAKYAWVQVLGPDDLNKLPSSLTDTVTGLVAPTPEQLGLFDDCLSAMAEAGQKSVRTVAMGTFSNGLSTSSNKQCTTVLGKTDGGQMVINADINSSNMDACLGPSKRRRFINTCVHEGAHAFTFLIAGKPGVVDWMADAKSFAQQQIQTYGLSSGLDNLFDTLQTAAVGLAESTHAVAYVEKTRTLSDTAAVAAGFASGYGAQNTGEDIAEYTAQMQFPNVAPGSEPALCSFFGSGGSLGPGNAIQYAKALLVRNIGLVDEQPFSACIHGLTSSIPSGIVARGSTDVQLTSGVDFGYFDQAGARMFGISGKGPNDYQGMLRVKVMQPGVAPLGLWRLDDITSSNIDAATSGFLLGNDGSLGYLKTLTSTGGLALITEITAHDASGLILFLQLGSLGVIPLETYPVVTFHGSK